MRLSSLEAEALQKIFLALRASAWAKNKGGSLDPPLYVISVVANTRTKSIQKHFVEYDVKSKYPEILDRR